MLAFALEKGERCVMCGTAPWEWDPAVGGSRHAYEPVEKFCAGCYQKAAMRHMDAGRNTDGITIELARNDRSQAAAQRHVRARRQAEKP